MRAAAHRTALDYHLAACLASVDAARELANMSGQQSAVFREASLASAHSSAVVALSAVTPDPDPPPCTACGGSGTISVARPPTDVEKVGLPRGEVPTSIETCQRCEGTGEDPTP